MSTYSKKQVICWFLGKGKKFWFIIIIVCAFFKIYYKQFSTEKEWKNKSNLSNYKAVLMCVKSFRFIKLIFAQILWPSITPTSRIGVDPGQDVREDRGDQTVPEEQRLVNIGTAEHQASCLSHSSLWNRDRHTISERSTHQSILLNPISYYRHPWNSHSLNGWHKLIIIPILIPAPLS